MRNPFRVGATAAAAALLLTFAACSNPVTETVAPVPQGSTSAEGSPSTGTTRELPESCDTDKPIVGISMANMTNPYYIAMQDGFEKSAEKLGFELNIAIANESDSTQLSQIQAFIQQKVCAVVMSAVNDGPGAASVKALNVAGIPIFTLNTIVSEEALKTQNAAYLQYVGPDQPSGGRQMGEAVLADFGTDAKIVAGIVGYPEASAVNQRDEAFTEVIESGNPNAKVIQTVNSKVDPNVAMQVTGDMLQANPDMNVVFASTGPGAVGALQAIKSAGRSEKTKLYAFCAAETPIEDPYAGCSAQEPARYADISLTNLKSYLAGEDVEHQVLLETKVFAAGETPPFGYVG